MTGRLAEERNTGSAFPPLRIGCHLWTTGSLARFVCTFFHGLDGGGLEGLMDGPCDSMLLRRPAKDLMFRSLSLGHIVGTRRSGTLELFMVRQGHRVASPIHQIPFDLHRQGHDRRSGRTLRNAGGEFASELCIVWTPTAVNYSTITAIYLPWNSPKGRSISVEHLAIT